MDQLVGPEPMVWQTDGPDVTHADAIATAPAGPRPKARLAIVDKLRGFVIVVMMLDHVRDFFHAQAFLFSPTDLAKTSVALFATRWVTHLCAPTFVLLAGVSIALQRARGKQGPALSRFLLIRGAWLILLEATIVGFGFDFWPDLFLQVIWAIGFGMIAMAGLTRLPPRAVLALGLAIVVGHDLLPPIPASAFGPWHLAWTLMMHPGPIPHGFLLYPALPWLGIMMVGYGAGDLVLWPAPRRDRTLVAIGVTMLALFVVLRAGNVYGDPAPWSAQASPAFTALSVLKVSKYPPSLLYTLVTLGLTISLAPAIARLGGPPGRLIDVMGRTPLFTYVLHLYVAHGLAMLVGIAMGFSPSIFVDYLADPSRAVAAHWGVSLPLVYVAWISVVLMLWPLSSWFAGVKQRRHDWWLSFL